MSAATSRGPVFLAGVDRSGIGLLGEVLECHPDVSMTRRTNFWHDYAGRFGDLSVGANLDRCLDRMARSRRLGVFAPDRQRLRADLAERGWTYAGLFEVLQVQLMERRGRVRWGDKSLGDERHADLILDRYPTARMVHVLRDPRDRFASQRSHRGPVRGGAGAGVELWRWSEQRACRNVRRHPGRYLVIRYEDLVSEPDSTLGGVCEFLQLDRGIDSSGPFGVAAIPFTTTSVGRHRHDLTEFETRFIDLAARSGMERHDYRPEPLALSWDSSLRFWLWFAPRHVVAALNWRLRDRIRHHRARRSERR